MKLTIIKLSYNVIFNELIKINPNKEPGPEGLQYLFMTNCAVGLSETLSSSVNRY